MKNKLIDPQLQKAFLPGLNGVIEHNLTLEELIRDAKHRKKTCHVTFIDLADAFGSVPHGLIEHSLKRNFFPQPIQDYVNSMYTNLKATVSTADFKTEVFRFRRGVFQGNPLSPVIFLLCFDPIIQYLNNISDCGYKLGDNHFINLPYADDFCVITRNKLTQQKILKDLSEKVKTLGMKIKPSKCRSFSISGGSPSVVPFLVDDYNIPSIEQEEQKYLGRVLFFKGKSADTFNLLKEKIGKKLENVEATAVRNEFKIEIYKMYILPSIRFLLTVHELPKTWLEKLDTAVDQQLKQWCGLPRSATRAVLHSPTTLDIPRIAHLYREAHAVQHAATRLKGDAVVQSTLEHKLERERERARSTITVEAEQQYESAMMMNAPLGLVPTDLRQFSLEGVGAVEVPADAPKSPAFIETIKEAVKSAVRSDKTNSIYEKCKTLIQQGSFLEMSLLEKTDAAWKSYIFQLPQGSMKWILNSAIDTLPTLANLKKWGKVSSDKCKLCKRWQQSLPHILNGCKVALNDSRYTWRHNGVLNFLSSCINQTPDLEVNIDLPGHQTTAGAGTLPPNIVVTDQIPDLCIINNKTNSVEIFELTIPQEKRIEDAHRYKTGKYSHFLTDIQGRNVSLHTIEVGSATGYINERNKASLKALHKYVKNGITFKNFTSNISAITVMSSHFIFNARNHKDWQSPGYVGPPLKPRGRNVGTN